MNSAAASGASRISVLVPTYRRPDDLRRCLSAIRSQQRAADEIVVICRSDDVESRAVAHSFAAGWSRLRSVEVSSPGQVHALNSGFEASSGDIVAITDDYAAPRPDWLWRVEHCLRSDPGAGGVGGRDWVHHGDQVDHGEQRVVGRMTWYGHCIGNHHLGVGSARVVDFLKGANMSYRRNAIGSLRFDERLRGSGAQVGNDMAFSMAVKRAGWRLIYDPLTAVDHYPAQRFDEDGRQVRSSQAQQNLAFNISLLVCENLGQLRSVAFLVWALLLGTRGEPGLLQAVRLLPREGLRGLRRAAANASGTVAGWRMSWR